MPLMKRVRGEIDWPEWPLARRLFDWPELWRDVAHDVVPIRVEEYVEDGMLIVRAEMPGLDPEKDVEISASDHTLHITAERREETKTEDKQGYRSEFTYGSFSRTLPLPVGATTDDVKATYTDGILVVRIPINSAEAEAKKIPIVHA